MSIESLTVVFYQEANQPAVTFEVPLLDGWFIFAHNLTFYHRTGYPGVQLTIYDAETGEFIPLLTAGGLLVDEVLHPWIVIRARELQHRECPNLAECVGSLLETRDEARVIIDGISANDANMNDGGAGVGGAGDDVENGGTMVGGVGVGGTCIGSVGVGVENGGAVGESTDDVSDDEVDLDGEVEPPSYSQYPVIVVDDGSDGEVEPPSCSQYPVIVVDDDLEDLEPGPSGSQYGVIIVDDDFEDTDYIDSEEEAEAVETGDEAEERKVIIDLTHLSD